MSCPEQIPSFSQDPRDPAFFRDPYPAYRHMRTYGDFVFWEDYGFPVATTHVAAGLVLRSPKLGREVPACRRPKITDEMAPFYAVERHSLLEIEPPKHTRLRQVAMQGFNRSSLAAMAPDISRLADRLIDGFPGQPFDLLQHFAQPLPAIAITRFLGVDEDHAAQFQSWSNDMVAMYQAHREPDVGPKAARAAADFSACLNQIIDAYSPTSNPGFLSSLIAAEKNGEIHSRDELISTVILLLNAGHEASVHTIGNSVRLLAGFPERALALEPTSITGTVEECLRFSPPLHMFTRHVYDDAVILGTKFKAGQEVGALLGSACHDDSVWPDGEHFDPFRPRRAHLAFGSGIHACLGATLARLELQIVLPILFSRCPGLTIVEPPEIADRYHFHGLDRLMVALR